MSARRRCVRLAVTTLAVLGTWGVAAGTAEAQIIGYIGEPAANGTVGQPFTISGWVVSPGAPSGTGVNAVHIYGCPASNCGTKTLWGAATYGLARPDVAAAYNNQNYLYSGYSFLMSGLTPNTVYLAEVRSHSTVTQSWHTQTVQFTATATPLQGVNSPTHLQALGQPVSFVGWAIDASAPTGTGVTAVDLWSYPNPGSGTYPQYLGSGNYGVSRPDVAAAFGARFQNSGYSKSVSGLAAGEHLFLRYAYSPTNGWFVTTTTNYVDVATVGLTIDRQGAGTGGVTASGLSCAGGASTQAVPCGTTYAFNTVVTLTAVPDSGSTFQGWGGVCSGTGTCQVTLTSARFVTARFGKVPSSYATKYYHADVIGSIRAITKENGTLDGDRHDYRPFGEDVAPLTGDPNRFAGKQLDAETALHYFDARYYRQTWGRFTSVDPLHVGAAMTDPQRWNRYAYAGNNPLKYGDPSGLSHGPVFGAQTDACAWGGTYPHCLPRPFGPDPGGQNGYIGGGIPGIGGRPGNNSGATTLIDHGNGTCSWAHPDDPSEAYFGPFACGDDTNTYTPQGPVQTVPTAGTPEGPGTTPGGPTNVPPPTAAPTTTSEVIRVGACMGDAGLGFLVGRAVPAYGVAQAMGMKLTPLTFAAGGSLFDLGVFGEGSYSGRDAAGVGTTVYSNRATDAFERAGGQGRLDNLRGTVARGNHKAAERLWNMENVAAPAEAGRLLVRVLGVANLLADLNGCF